jgi:hypothetical protein
MEQLLQFASVISAAIGATLATFSIQQSPEDILARIHKRGGMDVFGSDLEDILLSLSRQSKYALRAAFSAALAAIFQFLTYLIS